MTIKMTRFLLSAALTIISFTITPAIADEWNKETRFQFSAPVEVPGKVLEAGKYVFRLADVGADRNVVQIFSEDDKGIQRLVTTILAVPDYRLNTPDKTVVPELCARLTSDRVPSARPEACSTRLQRCLDTVCDCSISSCQ